MRWTYFLHNLHSYLLPTFLFFSLKILSVEAFLISDGIICQTLGPKYPREANAKTLSFRIRLIVKIVMISCAIRNVIKIIICCCKNIRHKLGG